LHVLTVSEINAYLREMLNADVILGDLWVQGEMANFKQAASGHCYFSLRDDTATLKAVMWRSHAAKLATRPTSGDAVLAHGAISFYETGGDIQLYVDALQPAGVGMLHAHFEQVKAMLETEGLFDVSRKRDLPPLPRRVGIATSAQGAALHDILTVLSRRCPLVEVVVSPCLVQGEQAPASIVAALHALYVSDVAVDVIILARGGGSLEDLWCFNEEAVARAVFASPVPLVTGVGHETDTTIVDYVADLRASTPSAAAELVAPELDTLEHQIEDVLQRLDEAVHLALAGRHQQLDDALARLQRHDPLTVLGRSRQQTDAVQRRIVEQVRSQLALHRARLQGVQTRLEVLNPQATLERGYVLVRRSDNGAVVSRVAQVGPSDVLTVTMHDGTFVVQRVERSG
jgi:exodeoxyribonuclease VII large subunit